MPILLNTKTKNLEGKEYNEYNDFVEKANEYITNTKNMKLVRNDFDRL